jgi:DNA polymerase-3 subunit gamma/tau
VVFARRFRPQTFAEVAGQASVTGALRQALVSGRVAQAYLFCGPRGVGKTSLARIFAKALNCQKGSCPGGAAEEPCNACPSCVAIQDGGALDVIEMDAATNRGIEEIRGLRENVGLAPAELRYKVYIIDEVHMLTREAWNAFLKTLEEPPPHVKFIFATTDPNNVPETILSRCQRFDLHRIGPSDIVKRLKQICARENLGYEELALSRIASLVRGGLRDAEGLLDQAVNLGGGKVTDEVVRALSGAVPDELIFEVLGACLQGQTETVLVKANGAFEAGAEPEDILNAFIERLRGALLAKVCGVDSKLLEGQEYLKEAYAKLSPLASEDQLMLLIQLFTAARRQMRDAAQARLPLEMALIRASRARELVDLGKLIGALEASGQSRPPPKPEPPRPNSPGRWGGNTTSLPAAAPEAPLGRSWTPELSAQDSTLPARARLIAAVRAQKGGALLGSALSFAALFNLDEAAGSLALGFAADNLFYKEALEKPDSQAALLAALKNVFGRDFKISVERVSGPGPAVPFAAPIKAAAKTFPAARRETDGAGAGAGAGDDSGAPLDGEEDGGTEIEFDEVEALPLRGAVPAPEAVKEESEADAVIDLKLPAANEAVGGGGAQRAPALKVDLQELAKDPLVQMVLQASGGMIVHAARGVIKTADAADKPR